MPGAAVDQRQAAGESLGDADDDRLGADDHDRDLAGEALRRRVPVRARFPAAEHAEGPDPGRARRSGADAGARVVALDGARRANAPAARPLCADAGRRGSRPAVGDVMLPIATTTDATPTAAADSSSVAFQPMLFGQQHVDRYRATDGEEGHEWQGGPRCCC